MLKKHKLANKLREYTIFDDPKVLKASMKATADILEEQERMGKMVLGIILVVITILWGIIVW